MISGLQTHERGACSALIQISPELNFEMLTHTLEVWWSITHVACVPTGNVSTFNINNLINDPLVENMFNLSSSSLHNGT